MSLRKEFWTEIEFPEGGDPIENSLREIGNPSEYWLSPVEHLKPVTRIEARYNSLSRLHGRGRQPPHTDGAHLERPPKFVLLWSEQANASHAQTHLRRLNISLLNPDFWKSFSSSIWSVRTSATRFHYRGTIEPNCGIRWDSACFHRCAVGELSAAEVDTEFETLPVVEFTWGSARALLMDNNRILHGRNDATRAVDDDRIIKRVSFYER